MNKYLRWLLYFIPVLLVEIICWFTNPIACLFVYKAYRTDVVKRHNKLTMSFQREYLKGIFALWSTHDNAADEYWWGLYNVNSWFKSVREWTQADYDHCAFVRYVCRVLWLSRNTAYGWNYKLFSLPVGEGWQIKKQIPLLFGYYNDVNIGWKAHKTKPRLLYANRIIGIRKYK